MIGHKKASFRICTKVRISVLGGFRHEVISVREGHVLIEKSSKASKCDTFRKPLTGKSFAHFKKFIGTHCHRALHAKAVNHSGYGDIFLTYL